MSSEKVKALENVYERLMAISLNEVPLEGIEDLVDPDVMGYGTTVDEQIFDLNGYMTLIRNQEKQAADADLEFQFNRQKVHRRISPEEDMALFVELIKATINSDQISSEFESRFSALFEYKNSEWKLVHWHGSIPIDTENDTWHIEEWKAEKKRMENLVEERTRELRETQEQLIQQEKLASLGQLTAGIAHEIKNPLNFVTNFSDLNIELLEEIRNELQGASGSSNSDVDHDLILEIMEDIEANLTKIYEHGSRADRIVKSMLQHSRGSEGVKEPTNLNELVQEYVTLSFHGMRAGDNPINVDLVFDLDKSIESVPLIKEDFTRVIVNLCNNAFDAMREKLTSDGGPKTGEKSLRQPTESAEAERRRGVSSVDDYTPKLTVRTRSENGSVTIEIEDNGPGIPEEMKDKILQPFFTTKKGTAGTGLGLSITNDIVKAHGGDLTISEAGKEGTTFKIELRGL